MNFKSDNVAGVCPEIMDAIIQANTGLHASYRNDSYSKKLTQKVSEIFKHEVFIFLTSTGTVANSLAFSALVLPHGSIFCYPRMQPQKMILMLLMTWLKSLKDKVIKIVSIEEG